MQKSLRLALGILALAAVIAALASPAVYADPPQSASGHFVVDEAIPTAVKPAGEIYLIDLTAVFSLEGTLDGAFAADFLIVHLGPIDEPAPEIFFAEGTFDGEVDGASGSFEFIFVGDIDAEGFAQGNLVIVRGTDELANLSGQITLAGIAGVEGSYEGNIHFAR